MAKYTVQAPDGNTYDVEGPDGASDDQVRAQVLIQHPDAGGSPRSSALMNSLKYMGNEAARVGIGNLTSIPLAFADVPVAIANQIRGKPNTNLPSQTYQQNLDASFPPDTSTAGKISEGLSSVIAGGGLGRVAGMALAPVANSAAYQSFLNMADKVTGGLDKIAPGLGIAESITHRSAYPMLAAAVPGAIRYAARAPSVESLVSNNGGSTLTGALAEWLRQEGAIQ